MQASHRAYLRMTCRDRTSGATGHHVAVSDEDRHHIRQRDRHLVPGWAVDHSPRVAACHIPAPDHSRLVAHTLAAADSPVAARYPALADHTPDARAVNHSPADHIPVAARHSWVGVHYPAVADSPVAARTLVDQHPAADQIPTVANHILAVADILVADHSLKARHTLAQEEAPADQDESQPRHPAGTSQAGFVAWERHRIDLTVREASPNHWMPGACPQDCCGCCGGGVIFCR